MCSWVRGRRVVCWPDGFVRVPPRSRSCSSPSSTGATSNTEASATKAQAAAVKVLGGGTAGAVTTDFTGNGYEVTVTKSDGSKVEVHLDSSFTGTSTLRWRK
jgi:hypothetical protein